MIDRKSKIWKTAADLLKYLFITLILFWSCMLFSSSLYIIFLCLFVGVISNFMLKDMEFLPRLAVVSAVTILFALIYDGAPRTPPLTMGYYVDIVLHNNRLMPKLIDNLKFFMFPIPVFLFSGFIGVSAGSFLKEGLKVRKIIAIVFLVVFIINFCLSVFALNLWSNYDTCQEPLAGKYTFDGHIYLRTLYLMKSGIPYYQSFTQALTEKQGGFTVTSVFNIRPPFITLLWSVMPASGMNVIRLFIIFSIVLFFLSYFTVLKDLKDPFLAMLTPVILSYLFFYGLTANWFTFHEYWAWFFLAVAVWARQTKHYVVMTVFFILCLLTRELFFVVWFLFMLFALINRNKEDLIRLGIVFFTALGYYLIHYYMVTHSISIYSSEAGSSFSFGQWLRGSSPEGEADLLFGSVTIYKSSLYLAFIVALYLLASINVFRNRLKLYYPLAVLPLMDFISQKLGVSATSYWGLLYLPAFGYLVPLLWYEKEEEEKGEAKPENKKQAEEDANVSLPMEEANDEDVEKSENEKNAK